MRVFAAIELPAGPRASVLAQHAGMPAAIWEPHPHVTLAHFGDLPPGRVTSLQERMRTVAFPAFELTPAGLGSFGEPGRPAVVWLGLEPSRHLDALADRLGSLRVDVVGRPDRLEFVPHVTLARTRAVEPSHVASFVRGWQDHSVEPFVVRDVSLIESVDGRYRLIESFEAANP